MKNITPHLWFDKEAKEAVDFYIANFPDSKIINISTTHEVPTPTGNCDIISFDLSGQPFMAINAGPLFKFNPSISFIVNFDPSKDLHARKNLDALWEKFSHKGTILVPIDKYPFSERYGWIQDKYGISWQLILSNASSEEHPFIVPSLMFTGAVAGHAEEAINFYLSIFKNSTKGMMHRYGIDMAPDKEGTIMFADFKLSTTWLAAMDSARDHDFSFNEAISLLIPCETQTEIDYFWENLSAVPEAEQCGWLKDKFGLSWQISPIVLDELMSKGTPEQVARVTKAFLQMKKFDIATLKKAFD